MGFGFKWGLWVEWWRLLKNFYFGLGFNGVWIWCLDGWKLVLICGLCLEWWMKIDMEVWRLMLWRFRERIWRMKEVVFFWMRKKRKRIFFFWPMGWHGRANSLENEGFFFLKNFFFGMWWVWFLVNGFKFFSLFRIIFGQIPTKQIKRTQNKQNKSN